MLGAHAEDTMVDATRLGVGRAAGLALPRADPASERTVGDPQREGPPPVWATIPSILLSQHGQAMTSAGNAGKPLAPGFPFPLEKLVVTSLNPQGGHGAREYAIDERGALSTPTGNPLTEGPFRLELVAKNGARYRVDVDFSDAKTGNRNSGYEELKNLKLTMSAGPRRPSLPSSVETAPFLLSRWGQLAMPESAGRKPLVDPAAGFTSLRVEQGGKAKTYAIDDQGRIDSGRGPTMDDAPAKLVLIHQSGARFEARVDVSSKKTKGVGESGYHELRPTFVRVDEGAPLGDVAADFAQTGGAKKEAPTLEASPLGVRFFSR
jgi:hypothetical protein